MTISCKLCGHKLHSQLPATKAQSHVLEQMTTHLGQKHKQEAQDLASMIAATTTYLLISLFVEIPPEETELLENVERNEELLFGILGADPQNQN